MDTSHYYRRLAAAFVRGQDCVVVGGRDCAAMDDGEAIEAGLRAGLRMHKFKRNLELPRVRKVIGMLRGIAPASLLDVGSGRGTFLWPLLDAMPWLEVTAIDRDERRARDLQAVRRGGVDTLACARMDARALGFTSGSFEVATLLEVLEHMHSPEAALAEAGRVARRFVVVSVPSKEDENPDHLHVIDNERLTEMLVCAGARRVQFDSVANHRIVIARMDGP